MLGLVGSGSDRVRKNRNVQLLTSRISVRSFSLSHPVSQVNRPSGCFCAKAEARCASVDLSRVRRGACDLRTGLPLARPA